MNDNRFVLCTSNTISSIIILHVQNCRRESSSRADQLKRIDKWHQSFHVIPLHSGQKPLKIANLPISKTNQFESPSLINSLSSNFGHPKATSHFLKLSKMSHFDYVIFAFSTKTCPIKIDLSGNTF